MDRNYRYLTVLFDLDGTLADTASDLGFALNLQLQERGRATVPDELIRPHASSGARGLLRLGFNLEVDAPEFQAMRSEFLDLYAENLARTTTLFPGVAELLDGIEARGLSWGIVTNKPERFTFPLLEALNLHQRAACVVCGDTTARPKPDPAPLLHACALLNQPPGACIYIGDDERDVVAAIAAGMDSVVALYGYLGEDSDPRSWGANASIEDPRDLLAFLDGHEARI
ncbi:MAG: HAD-IA family hydrolase [Burkholderiales bacterium]